MLTELLTGLFKIFPHTDSQWGSKNLRALFCKISIPFNNFADENIHTKKQLLKFHMESLFIKISLTLKVVKFLKES